jgi:hypothetical protein
MLLAGVALAAGPAPDTATRTTAVNNETIKVMRFLASTIMKAPFGFFV